MKCDQIFMYQLIEKYCLRLKGEISWPEMVYLLFLPRAVKLNPELDKISPGSRIQYIVDAWVHYAYIFHDAE